MKVLAMFVGELDYSDTLVNPLSQSKNGVPLVPLPELTFILFAAFFITVPILLMNLLVSTIYKSTLVLNAPYWNVRPLNLRTY